MENDTSNLKHSSHSYKPCTLVSIFIYSVSRCVYAVDRKLNTKEREDVKKLIDLGAPVRKIQTYISTSYREFTPTFSGAFLISKHV